MPIRKRHQTRAEAAQSLAYLRQLQAEGIDIEFPEAWQERSCPLEITAGREFGIICDLPRGGVGYAIPLRMVAQSRLILEDYDIRSSWDDYLWLPQLERRGPCLRLGPLEYLTKDVVNERIEDLRFNFGGDMVEGMLLAFGSEPIPEQYGTPGMVPVEIAFSDTLHRKIAVEVKLLLEPSPKRQQEVLPPKTGRYDPVKKQESGGWW